MFARMGWTVPVLLLLVAHCKVFGDVALLQNAKFPTKCLQVKGNSQENYAQYELADCNEINPNQLMQVDGWKAYTTTAGYLKFQFDGKCITGVNQNNENFKPIIQWDCVDQPHQYWKFINGAYERSFQIQNAQNGKCLTAETTNTFMYQWDCLGAALHQFWVVRVLPTKGLHGLLKNVKYGKCVHPVKTGKENGVQYQLTPCSGFSNDQYVNTTLFKTYGTTAGPLRIKNSGRCLTGPYMSTTNGDKIVQWDCVGQPHQTWKIILGSYGGSFQLQEQTSKKCITAGPEDATLYQWDCDFNHDNQYFTIEQEEVDIQCMRAGYPCGSAPYYECCPGATCLMSTHYCQGNSQCTANGQGCGYAIADACCSKSCVIINDQQLCHEGTCSKPEESCSATQFCCAPYRCQDYNGKQICRPSKPDWCFSPGGGNHNYDGTCVGLDRSPGKCCSGICEYSTSSGTFYAHSGGQNYDNGKCTCSRKGSLCKSNSDCCEGNCGALYKCI